MTTTNLNKPRARWLDLPVPVAIAICLFAILAIAGLLGKIHSAASVAAVPTPGLVILIATPQPEPVPIVAPVQVAYQQPPRHVVGFDSPNGNPMGAIPAPEPSAIVARFGDEWLQTTHDGAPIWIRAADVGMQIADLAPPAVVYVVSQPHTAPARRPPTRPATGTPISRRRRPALSRA
jgi:hypothetical protein